MSEQIHGNPQRKTVVWTMSAYDARDWARFLDEIIPSYDGARDVVALLNDAADKADPPPDPDAPGIRILIDMDQWR